MPRPASARHGRGKAAVFDHWVSVMAEARAARAEGGKELRRPAPGNRIQRPISGGDVLAAATTLADDGVGKAAWPDVAVTANPRPVARMAAATNTGPSRARFVT